MRKLFCLLCFISLPVWASVTPLQTCSTWFSQMQRHINNSAYVDVQAANVTDFPYLKVNRFLSSYRNQTLTPVQQRYWEQQLADLARQAFIIEMHNLPYRNALWSITPKSLQTKGELLKVWNYCSALWLQDDAHDLLRQQLLQQQARVPSAYRLSQRIVGLYPLTRYLALHFVMRYQAKIRKIFETPLPDLPVSGTLITYQAPAALTLRQKQVAQILQLSAHNPLHIPKPNRQRADCICTAGVVNDKNRRKCSE